MSGHDEACSHPSHHRSTSDLPAERISSKLTDLTGIDVTDSSLMRGISLRKTLRQGGSLWLCDPSALTKPQRLKLYTASRQTSRYDKFLSHTWHTSGGWKLLALMMHTGWHAFLISWVLGVAVAFTLVLLDVLPQTTLWEAHAVGFHGTIPYGFWVSTVSVPTAIGGLLLYPYLPHRSSDICFLDYVCVDQTDTARMQQGIRSIGAFLASSKELRVLWSAPYLKRLWCVFELAAFRKLNPQGQIIISPLLSEATVYLMFLWVQLASAAFLAVRTGPNGGDPLRFLMLLVGSFLLLFPTLSHAGSTKHRADKLLQAQLSSFDVTKVECSSEFDKQSIHEAIISWYGSLDAFSNHIRGPFRLEVTELLRTRGSLSPQYIYIATLPIFCLSLEGLLALSKAGAPWQSILGFFLAHVLGLDVLWLPAVANLGAYMTKRGLRVCGRRMMPYSLEFTIVFVLSSILFVAGGFCTVIVSAQSLTTVLVWVLVALVFAFGCWKFCWRV